MRWFYSHFNGVVLAFFTLITFYPVCAEDIEIDLGGNSSSASKSSASVVENPGSNLTKTLAGEGTEANTPSEIPGNKSGKIKNTLKSVVSQVSVLQVDGGEHVLIEGKNLPSPQVSKISGRKILIKFQKTNLNIPSKIIPENALIKDIRSSSHSEKTAWIVLDLTSAMKWEIIKSEKGYILAFDSNRKEETDSKDLTKDKPSLSNENAAPSEKGLFSRLIDVSVKPVEKGLKIVLTSDGPSKYTVQKLSQPEKLIIRFHDTKLEIAEKFKKSAGENPELKKGGLLLIEMRQIGSPFSPISEALFTLAPGTVHQIDHDLNQVVITLTAPPPQQKEIVKRGNLNQLVSLDIEGADLNAVVKTLASEAGFDVDMVGSGSGSTSLTGFVNEKFKDIPLKTALATLLTPGGYNFEVQGNTLRIGLQASLIATKANLPHVIEIISPSGGMAPQQFDSLVRSILKPTNATVTTPDPVRNVLILNGTPSDIEDYKRAIQDLKLDESSNSSRITRIVKLNYADAVQLSGILTAYLTPVGKVQVDGQKLVIWEVASNMGVLLELIKELDHKPAQVLIESDIVEVDDEKDLNIGINWSASKNSGDPTVSSSFNNPPVNAQGAPGNFSFGTIKSGLNISASLQALETNKKGKIVSRPRVATASGVLATINSTENVVIATTTTTIGLGGAVQTTTAFTTLPLPINLSVTPRITDDGRITTQINASITSQSGPAQGAGAPPPTSIQTATTTITTKNGETIVIGGLVRETITDIINGIPLLSSLPILGTLFQERERSNQKVELVIFITPTILED